jgi:hypothetical protein
MNLKLMSAFSLSVSIVFLPISAEAGSRRCQSYPNNTSACITETGLEFTCTHDAIYSTCIGKNYRKECKQQNEEISICNDSNGVKTVCKHDQRSGAICENNKGYKSVCRFYNDGNYSICTNVSRWGKPIKS